jgi:hypothetical protein
MGKKAASKPGVPQSGTSPLGGQSFMQDTGSIHNALDQLKSVNMPTPEPPRPAWVQPSQVPAALQTLAANNQPTPEPPRPPWVPPSQVLSKLTAMQQQPLPQPPSLSSMLKGGFYG